MKKIHRVEFTTDEITIEELKARLSEIAEKTYADDKQEMARVEAFIKTTIELAKAFMNDKDFSKNADGYCAYLLKHPNYDKRSFYVYYSKSMADALEDVVGLVSDYKLIKENANKKAIKIKNTKNNQKEKKL